MNQNIIKKNTTKKQRESKNIKATHLLKEENGRSTGYLLNVTGC